MSRSNPWFRRIEGARPQAEGPSPQSAGRRAFLRSLGVGAGALAPLAVPGLGGLLAGCSSATDRRTQSTAVIAITETTAPAVTTEEDAIYQVTRPMPVPLTPRPPSNVLGAAIKPFPRGLWYTTADLRVQCTYVISNLTNAQLRAEILFDVWNEFLYYAPTVTVSEEDGLQADRSSIDRLVDVPARSRLVASVSFDDFERAAVALAIMQDPARPNDFHLVEPSTNLFQSALAKPYLPSVIPGIAGFDLSLRVAGAVGAPPKVVVEATLELEDRTGNLLVKEGADPSPNRTKQSMGRQPLVPRVLVPET